MNTIIFDFDGTLADTLPICYDAFQHVFREFDNKELTPDQIKAMFGPSEMGIIRENLSHINKDQAIELYYEKYLQNHAQLVKKNEEIDDLLTHLKEKGFKLGIVTGKERRSLDISLKALHMDSLFDVIITGDDVEKPKPHPEGILKALSIFGVQNDQAMFIGDSEADILAGVQANVTTIGVQWLPEYQTLDFSIQPSRVFKSVKEFKKSLE